MRIKYKKIHTPEQMFRLFLSLHTDSLNVRKAWVYRGQKCSDPKPKGFRKLRTSLEKALFEGGHLLDEAPRIEMGLFRKFKRQSEQFLAHIPGQGDYLEWLALMQHHGAPTRLLDWSYSFFVALYFAVAELGPKESAELWAVDIQYLNSRMRTLFPRCSDRRCAEDDPNAQVHRNFERMFMRRKPEQFVCSMNPYRFNTRLIIQQGTFLCPGDITRPFGENLESHFASQDELDDHMKVFKIEGGARNDLMQVLYRMNIGEASLFPGLDGFARSLRDVLPFREVTKMFPPDSLYVKKKVWRETMESCSGP